jgi:hypothetical protein
MHYSYKRYPFVPLQTESLKPYKLTLVGFFSRTQRVPPLQGFITGSPNLGRCEFVSNRPPLAVLLDKLGRRGSGTCSYWFTGSNNGGVQACIRNPTETEPPGADTSKLLQLCPEAKPEPLRPCPATRQSLLSTEGPRRHCGKDIVAFSPSGI